MTDRSRCWWPALRTGCRLHDHDVTFFRREVNAIVDDRRRRLEVVRLRQPLLAVVRCSGRRVEHSTMSGDVHIRHAAGCAKARTMIGDIRLDTVHGWIEATHERFLRSRQTPDDVATL